MNVDYLLILGILIFIGFLGYLIFRKPKVSIETKVTGRGKSILQDYNHLGGEFEVVSVRAINDDKSLFTFSNGVTLQIYHNDLEPVDNLQCFAGVGKPVWRLRYNGHRERQDALSQRRKEEKTQRERDFEHGRSKYYESNIQRETDKRIEHAIRLSRAGHDEKVKAITQ